jgi:hypothetical protein
MRSVDVSQVRIQPVEGGRPGALGGYNFNDVAVFQGIAEGHQLAVNLGPDTAVTEVGVNAVSKIKGGSALGEVFDFTFRSIDKHLVDENIRFNRFEEFFSAGKLAVPFDELAEPGDSLLEFNIRLIAPL